MTKQNKKEQPKLEGFTIQIWNDPKDKTMVHMKVSPTSGGEERLKGTLAEKFAMLTFGSFSEFAKKNKKVKESIKKFSIPEKKEIIFGEKMTGKGLPDEMEL